MENVIGKKIEELRKNSGETQDAVAFALGVSRQTLYRWEANIRIPNAKQLNQLCEYFKISADYFLNNSENDETAVAEEKENVTETAEAAVSVEAVAKKSAKTRKLFNIGIIISSFLFAFSSVLLTVICCFTFKNEGGIDRVIIIEGLWVLYVLAVLTVISLAGMIAFFVLKKRKCNRLGTKKLQTNKKNSDKMK